MTSETRQRIERYVPATIERKWRERWDRDGLYATPDDSPDPNFYFVTMYPYPSGVLHVGHWYAMAPSDAAARYLRMKGHNVLFPMGFDAFGLPSENAAIKTGRHPSDNTEDNMAAMRRQFREMGTMIDWRREVVVCHPDYYKWNQWLFLKLYERGLAYRANAPVNWCPKDETVLANEQVINGLCERCSTPVVKKDLTQWFFKITDYADELLSFDGIDWPERVVVMQTNWIGRSEGARLSFDVEGHPGERIEFFTTRPDTIYGATFMVLAPEHSLVRKIVTPEHADAVLAYVEQARNQTEIERTSTEREKTGVDTGAFAINPFSGERVPVWIADYVLATYGTGAIMAVPAHDERDFDFAKKHGLPIREVISPDGTEHELTAAYVDAGVMVRSGPLSGLPSEKGKAKVIADAQERGNGAPSVTYRLRDWLISRQRYWGTPIPIIYCGGCGTVPVPYDQLPVELPYDVDFKPGGGSPLARKRDFIETTCPRCGGPAERDPDTMDTFVDSSWYMYRYTDPNIDTAFMNEAVARKWLPVTRYTGGIEHAILHLLYARFICKALADMGYLWFREPFTHMRNQGHIVFKGRKMSKSRGNVQGPDDYVARYGADTLRLFMMFMGPWTAGADWDDAGIEGVYRFLHRTWELALMPAGDGPRDPELDAQVHRTIRKVTTDLESYHFNTAVAALMELRGALANGSGPSREDGVRTLLLLLAPMAPHVTEELWERRGGVDSIHTQRWPVFDPAKAATTVISLVIQVDGKVRDKITAPAGLEDAAAVELARGSQKVKGALAGRQVVRHFVVKDRLVNLVTR